MCHVNCKKLVNCYCSGDETLKPRASIEDGSISSDEENDASLDVSSSSDAEDGALTGSDAEVPYSRPEDDAAQVFTFS